MIYLLMIYSMYLLDTNALIYLLNGKEQVIHIFDALQQEYLCISSMTRFEAEVGIEKEQIDHQEWLAALDTFTQLPFDAKVVAKAVPLFLQLGAKRHMFKDAIIAATAITFGLTLLTADKEFTKIPGLKVHLIEL